MTTLTSSDTSYVWRVSFRRVVTFNDFQRISGDIDEWIIRPKNKHIKQSLGNHRTLSTRRKSSLLPNSPCDRCPLIFQICLIFCVLIPRTFRGSGFQFVPDMTKLCCRHLSTNFLHSADSHRGDLVRVWGATMGAQKSIFQLFASNPLHAITHNPILNSLLLPSGSARHFQYDQNVRTTF